MGYEEDDSEGISKKWFISIIVISLLNNPAEPFLSILPLSSSNKINDNFGDQVLVTSGTNALTADWNAGEYKITAGSVSIEDGSAASPSLLLLSNQKGIFLSGFGLKTVH